MSAIAQILLAQGEKVSGSDLADNALFGQIRLLGGKVYLGHKATYVRGVQQVVYSSSITPQNPELIEARNKGIPVLHRGQMVARLVNSKRTVAVTGAHGKSTTAGLASELLIKAGLDPTVILGAQLQGIRSNARLGRGRTAVVEADESDGSLLWLSPAVIILTNVDDEHLDYFRNSAEILENYTLFVRRLQRGGTLIGCADDPKVVRVLSAASRRKITYGLTHKAHVRAQGVELISGGSRWRCLLRGKSLGKVTLKIPGIHNVVNSLAVVALAEVLGIDFSVTQAALENFSGAKRRFEIRGEVNGILVVEDYGHHPAEIEATLRAARSFPGRKIHCVFQPHRYTRTQYLFDQFVSVLSRADRLTLLPIYAASEEPIGGVESDALARAIRNKSGKGVDVVLAEELLDRLSAQSQSGDLILFQGAGSVGSLAGRFVKQLKERGNGASHRF